MFDGAGRAIAAAARSPAAVLKPYRGREVLNGIARAVAAGAVPR